MLLPRRHQHRAASLTTLGVSLAYRFESTSIAEDLEESLTVNQELLALRLSGT